MRFALAAACLLVPLLAGCSNSPAPDDDFRGATNSPGSSASETTTSGTTSTAANPSAVPRLTLDDCTNAGGVFPVPMAAARAALPEGFEPVVSASDPQGGATLYVLALECNSTTIDNESSGPVRVIYAELAVTPPPEYEVAGITDYTVPLVFGATSDAVGAVVSQYKLGVSGFGTVEFIAEGVAGPRRVEITVETVTISITAQASPAPPTALGSSGFVLFGVQELQVQTIILASSAGGQAVEAAAAMQSEGSPLLAQARTATRGFSVSGFSLSFEPQPAAA